jgi:hypothetical protein
MWGVRHLSLSECSLNHIRESQQYNNPQHSNIYVYHPQSLLALRAES